MSPISHPGAAWRPRRLAGKAGEASAAIPFSLPDHHRRQHGVIAAPPIGGRSPPRRSAHPTPSASRPPLLRTDVRRPQIARGAHADARRRAARVHGAGALVLRAAGRTRTRTGRPATSEAEEPGRADADAGGCDAGVHGAGAVVRRRCPRRGRLPLRPFGTGIGGIPPRHPPGRQGRAHLGRLPRPRRLARPRHRRPGRESRDCGRGGVRRGREGAGERAGGRERRVRHAGCQGPRGVEEGGGEDGAEVRQAQRADPQRGDRQLGDGGRLHVRAVGRHDRHQPHRRLQRPPRLGRRAQSLCPRLGDHGLVHRRAAGLRRDPRLRRGQARRPRAGEERRALPRPVRHTSKQPAPGDDREPDDGGPAQAAEARGPQAGGQGARAFQDGCVFGVRRVFVFDGGRVRGRWGGDRGAGDGLERMSGEGVDAGAVGVPGGGRAGMRRARKKAQ